MNYLATWHCKISLLFLNELSGQIVSITANESNHFWDFIYRILKPNYPPYLPFDFNTPKEDRYQLLLSNGIAIWDVISNCFRQGSNDSEIKDPAFNDIYCFVDNTQIKKVFCNGNNAFKYMQNGKISRKLSIPVIKLNSTSSLNPNNTFYIFQEWQHHLTEFL